MTADDPMGLRRRTTSLSPEVAAINTTARALADAIDLRWTEQKGLGPDDHVQELLDAYRNACSTWSTARRER